MILPFPIFLPDAVKSVRDQILPVLNGRAAGLPDGAGQVAGGIKADIRAKLCLKTLGQPIQQPGGAQHKTAPIDNLEKLKRIFTLLPTSYDAIDYTKIHEVKKFYPKIYEKIMNRLDLAWEHTNILVKKCIDEGLIKKVNIYLMKSVLIGSIRIILEDNNLRKEKIDYSETMKNIVDIMFDGLTIN